MFVVFIGQAFNITQANLEQLFNRMAVRCVLIELSYCNYSSVYTKINWQKVAKALRKPSWIFDSRSIIDKEEVIKAGISLWRLGDGLN